MTAKYRLAESTSGVGIVAPDTNILVSNGDGTWSPGAQSSVAVQPFLGTYHVDPTFTGVSTGSESNPFKTYAAVFAYAAALAIFNGIVFQAPGTNVVENVTFPATAGDWEIATQPVLGGVLTTITGNVVVNCSVSSTNIRRAITRLTITGAITGNNSSSTANSCRLIFTSTTIGGVTTLTTSGPGFYRLATNVGVPGVSNVSNVAYSFFQGAVTVAGTVWAATAQFASTLSLSGRCSFFNCFFANDITTTAEIADDNSLFFNNCSVPVRINISQSVAGRLALIAATNSNFDSSTINFSGIGINAFGLDAASAQTFFQHGGTLTGATVSNGPGTMVRARLTLQVNNIGLTTFAFKNPIPQLRANGTLTLVTPGTLGAAVLKVTYTDSIGVPRTKAITPALNIAGAVGDEVQGSLLFTQDGSTTFQYSVDGIVTPGAMRYNLAISLEPAM